MWVRALWVLLLLCEVSLAALPAKPENISCVFYYKKNLTCTWSAKEAASPTWYTIRKTSLLTNENDTCTTGDNRASFGQHITIPDDYIIQVAAHNKDGTVDSDAALWSLDAIVKMEPPVISSVKPVQGTQPTLQIEWGKPELAPASSTLNCTLRFREASGTHWTEVSFHCPPGGARGTQTYRLSEKLRAFTQYAVALRCAANGSSFWSDWSREETGMTAEEAPVGLELWRILRPARGDGSRRVRLLWKKASGAPVLERALGYHVSYFPESNTNLTESRKTDEEQLDVNLGDEAYRVSVVSFNSAGQSPAATLRIPAAREKPFPRTGTAQVRLTRDQLVVAWQSSAPDVDTWMVEWFPDQDSEPSIVCWESVSGARNWTIRRDKLKPFQCYNISVYPMLPDQVGEPYSIQAYGTEGEPLEGPATKVEDIGVTAATIVWEEIPKSSRRGFISNYTVFYQGEDGKKFAQTVSSSILQYGLKSLTRGMSYTVQVMASTSAGGINGSSVNFKTLSVSVLEFCLITSLVVGGLLVLVALAVAYGLRKPNKLKHLCWPTVPNPAESSIATWHGGDLKDKLNLKEFEDSVNIEEDGILKPCPASSDLIDKLVVNFESFLEEVSAKGPGKGQEDTPGWDKNDPSHQLP